MTHPLASTIVSDTVRSHEADALRAAARQQQTVAALGLLALGGASIDTVLAEGVSRTAEALGGAHVELVEGPTSAAISASIDDPRHQLCAIVAQPRDGTQFIERDLHFLQSVANILSAYLQRLRLDMQARRRERWLRAYVERSPDLILPLDSDARFLDANPAAERSVGASVASLRGQSSQRLGMSDATFGAWRIAVQQVFALQRDQSLDVQLETVHALRVYTAQLTAIADDRGNVEFVGAILRDVTERVLRDRARAWGIAALTPRERTILRLLASGQTNREIALKLGLSAGTIKNRIGLLLPKLGAADRTQAVAIAIQLGLLDGPGDPLQPAPEPAPLPYFNLGEFD